MALGDDPHRLRAAGRGLGVPVEQRGPHARARRGDVDGAAVRRARPRSVVCAGGGDGEAVGVRGGRGDEPDLFPAAAITIIPASTASWIASASPKKPLPPRLIDTTWHPTLRAQRTALATSESKTCTTLSVARIGTSGARRGDPLEPRPSPARR